jgi:hypothetical protein
VTDDLPAPNQLEISVFGPGIGESIVVHLGDGDWIVIDSCIDRRSGGGPVALQYLRSLGVDVGTQVRLVVATHWHDDHIQGLAEILAEAKSARFVNSAAYQLHELIKVVKLGAETSPLPATKEFNSIIRLLEDRRRRGEKKEAVGPVPALANKRILALTAHHRSISAEVFALSPSDGVFNIAQAELSNALSEIRLRRRPLRQGPNQLSIVLWLKVGVLNVLLGADLEHVPGLTEGWNAIARSSERPEGRAAFFKVPHHGSHNADSPECWANLLSGLPTVFLTPYAPSRLPRAEDIDRICLRSGQVYLTSNSANYGLPRRENAVEKTLREIAVKRRSLRGLAGHIRLRCDALDVRQTPLISLTNGATKVCG